MFLRIVFSQFFIAKCFKKSLRFKKRIIRIKERVFETQLCFTSVSNSHYHDFRGNFYKKVAAPLGDFDVKIPWKMRSLKPSVLCFCASRCIKMFKVISHTGASSDVDRKTNNYYSEYLKGWKGIRHSWTK